MPNLEDVRTRGVAVGRRLSRLAGASILARNAVYSASRHVGTAFHTDNGVGSHDQIDFGAQSHGPFTRCLRFAAFLPAPRSYGHARLASGWGSTFAGRAFQLARSLVKFPLSLHSLPPHPGFAWRTASSIALGARRKAPQRARAGASRRQSWAFYRRLRRGALRRGNRACRRIRAVLVFWGDAWALIVRHIMMGRTMGAATPTPFQLKPSVPDSILPICIDGHRRLRVDPTQHIVDGDLLAEAHLFTLPHLSGIEKAQLSSWIYRRDRPPPPPARRVRLHSLPLTFAEPERKRRALHLQPELIRTA